MFQRDSQGNISGGTTLRIGNSSITVGGQLARGDVRKLRQWLNEAERYYQTAGVDAYQDSGDWLSEASSVANVVRDVANSPIGTTVAGLTGPYGAAVLGAANAVPAALDALKKTGIAPEHAVMSSQLLHPDKRVRDRAIAEMRRINEAAAKGNTKAQSIRRGLQVVMVQQLQHLLRERDLQLAAARQRLAELGDPLAYDFTSGYDDCDYETAGIPVPTALPAGANQPSASPPALTAALARALNRARLSPQPSFRPRLTARA